jgi:hypothetical protein
MLEQLNVTETPIQPVRIDERLIDRVGVREWGLPSLCMPGKLWRSEKHNTITCMLPHPTDSTRVRIETRPLVILPVGEMSWMPDNWRAALWEYVQAWFYSGCVYGPFLAITEEQRCDMIRKMAQELVKSDNIGCCSIANAIGEFSAYGYQLVSDSSSQPRSAAQAGETTPPATTATGETGAAATSGAPGSGKPPASSTAETGDTNR